MSRICFLFHPIISTLWQRSCTVRMNQISLHKATSHVFFSNIARNDDRNYLSFGVNYISVAQKLRILAILSSFDLRNPFLADSIDDRRKIKAEILSFKMRCYVYKIKLRVRLRLQVATIKNASCTQLRTAFGMRSCECGKSK